jgi:serine/threonine protein kinase
MLVINDLMCGKLVVQMKLAEAEVIRELLRRLEADSDSAFTLPNYLFKENHLNEDQVRRLRSFVALYNYVRNESLYLRVLEKKKLVTRNFIQRLVALLEAEWYRRRVGDVLLTMDQICSEEDQRTQGKVLRQVDAQDRRILNRYRSEDFKSISNPLVPSKNVNLKAFRLSTVFRGKQTRTFVRKHLKEHGNAATSIEDALNNEFKAAPAEEAGYGDFGEIWALPDDILLASGADPKTPQPVVPVPPTRQISILLPPRVRASGEGFAATMKFDRSNLQEEEKSYIDDYEIVFGPRYEAFGQAFYRVQKANGPECILQSIDPRVAPAREVARFVRQLKVLRKLNHDNCLRLVGEKSRSDGISYMVLPELQGQTIMERLKTSAFPMVEAFDIAERLLDALSHVHKHRFVYRDLRPDNVLLLKDRYAYPIIKDFRLVWIAKSSLPAAAQAYRTRADELLGNPAYLAPETMTNDPVDERTDLYSFAIVLFEMLTGSLPLRASSPEEYLSQHLIGQPYSLVEVCPDIDWHPDLENWLASLLAKNRKDRPPTAAEALAQLKQFKNAAVVAAATMPTTVRHDPRALVSGIFNEFFKMEM